MNLEECIKDLDPELREKAHACGSEDELRSFLENEIHFSLRRILGHRRGSCYMR